MISNQLTTNTRKNSRNSSQALQTGQVQKAEAFFYKLHAEMVMLHQVAKQAGLHDDRIYLLWEL